MSEIAAAVAQALRATGDYIVVTGRPTPGTAPLLDAARRRVVAPGPTTRLAVAAGVQLGGHRAVTVVDATCDFTDGHGGVALTESSQAATSALRCGWSVVQPWRSDDVASLLAGAPRPTVVLLAGADTGVQTPLPPDVLAADDLRIWQDGELATLIAAGPAVAALVRVGRRLEARGVPVTAVEVAVLTSAAQTPLIGGDALHVGGPRAGDALASGDWPANTQRVGVSGVDDAELIGAVMSQIRTR